MVLDISAWQEVAGSRQGHFESSRRHVSPNSAASTRFVHVALDGQRVVCQAFDWKVERHMIFAVLTKKRLALSGAREGDQQMTEGVTRAGASMLMRGLERARRITRSVFLLRFCFSRGPFEQRKQDWAGLRAARERSKERAMEVSIRVLRRGCNSRRIVGERPLEGPRISPCRQRICGMSTAAFGWTSQNGAASRGMVQHGRGLRRGRAGKVPNQCNGAPHWEDRGSGGFWLAQEQGGKPANRARARMRSQRVLAAALNQPGK